MNCECLYYPIAGYNNFTLLFKFYPKVALSADPLAILSLVLISYIKLDNLFLQDGKFSMLVHCSFYEDF